MFMLFQLLLCGLVGSRIGISVNELLKGSTLNGVFLSGLFSMIIQCIIEGLKYSS